MNEVTMQDLVALCKGRGFVFPGSEIYGGLANTWDYGPLGVELKNNIKKYSVLEKSMRTICKQSFNNKTHNRMYSGVNHTKILLLSGFLKMLQNY